MRKHFTAVCIALAALIFAWSFAVIAADAPDTISIKPALWSELTKGPVEFSHKKHNVDYKLACTECHHKYENGTNVWKQGDPVDKCEKCHTEPTITGEKKLTADQQKLNLKLAFHNNCIECHKTYKKDHPDTTAPVVCAKCHPKGNDKQ